MEQLKTTPIYYVTVSRGEWLGLSVCCHTGVQTECVPAVILIWSSGSSSKLLQFVSRIQSLAAVGLKSLFSC